MKEKPDIIFILTDQQSAGMMGCAGNNYVKTPALDSLAERGVRFFRAYCTNPVCVPSRFSLMTGHYSSRIRMRSNAEIKNGVPKKIVKNSLGWLMRRAGYQCYYGGKIHLPADLHPENNGFEVLSKDERDVLADNCAEFIRQKHESPYFLYASFINPHDICFMAIEAFQDFANKDRVRVELETLHRALHLPEGISEKEFFDKICPPLPPNFAPQEDEPEAIELIRKQRPFKMNAWKEWTEKEWRLHRWAYCKLTEFVDTQIGKLLDAVRESRNADNTVIIFSSDHGDSDSAHRMEHKTMLYEEPTNVPLIISQPGLTNAGTVDDHLVSNGLDLLPTLCDYAGADLPEGIDGLSLRPLVEGQSPESWRDHVFVESEFGNMVRTENYKYAVYDAGSRREQLYDMTNDPCEMKNAMKNEAVNEIVDKHRFLLNNYQAKLLLDACKE